MAEGESKNKGEETFKDLKTSSDKGIEPPQKEMMLDLAKDTAAPPGNAKRVDQALPADESAAAPVPDSRESDAAPDSRPAEESLPAEDSLQAEEDSEVPVIELINNAEGCWKVLQGGERLPLSDDEWRKELAHVLSRNRSSA